jgi:hypothetical protein
VITDLQALDMALKAFCPDLELVPGQTHFKTWKDSNNGRLVGDWKLPTGMTEEEVGNNARAVIRVKEEYLQKKGIKRNDANAPYEIGLVPVTVKRDAQGNVESVKYDPAEGKEYVLQTDFWAQGQGIMKCEGVGAHKTGRNPDTGQEEDRSFEDLTMYYRLCEAKRIADRNGDNIHFDKLPDGTYVGKVDTQLRVGVS